MNVRAKLGVLEYLTNLADAKNKESTSVSNKIRRGVLYIKYWLQSTSAIDFHLDFENMEDELNDLDTHVKVIIDKAERDLSILDECLVHFQAAKSKHFLVGREYCINVLKSAKVRLRTQ